MWLLCPVVAPEQRRRYRARSRAEPRRDGLKRGPSGADNENVEGYVPLWVAAAILLSGFTGFAVRRGSFRRELTAARLAATRDPLTRLSNRLLFAEVLDREVARHLRTGAPLSLVLLDLDGFKEVNDTRGHLAGDELLRGVARAISGRTRRPDLIARLGGDEFAMLLPECPAVDACGVADTIRRRVATAGEGLVTASAGVAALPDHAGDPGALVAAADRALYVAKGSGRNRTALAGPVSGP